MRHLPGEILLVGSYFVHSRISRGGDQPIIHCTGVCPFMVTRTTNTRNAKGPRVQARPSACVHSPSRDLVERVLRERVGPEGTACGATPLTAPDRCRGAERAREVERGRLVGHDRRARRRAREARRPRRLEHGAAAEHRGREERASHHPREHNSKGTRPPRCSDRPAGSSSQDNRAAARRGPVCEEARARAASRLPRGRA